MSDRPKPADAGTYEIRLGGTLDRRWEAWFDGLAVSHEPDGTTVLRGAIADQAALHGLLARIRDLGIPLLAVTRDGGERPEHHTTPEPIDTDTHERTIR